MGSQAMPVKLQIPLRYQKQKSDVNKKKKNKKKAPGIFVTC